MSDAPSLHNYVDHRFREAFGEPHTSMGKDDHWRLLGPSSPLAINVLLNGTRDIPALWVFDSHDETGRVFSASITREDQVHELIQQIQERVKRAGASTASPNA